MSPFLAGIFALIIGAAGWFYLFYSKAAQKLQGVEDTRINQRRVRLRRSGGFSMILLAMAMYAGVAGFDWERPTIWFALVWVLVMALVLVITVLALIDIRLTKQLRTNRKREQP
jgi:Na+/H+ antiporter NhaD/arsenite permease-like protein